MIRIHTNIWAILLLLGFIFLLCALAIKDHNRNVKYDCIMEYSEPFDKAECVKERSW
jgi:hypothetical protein